MTNGSPPMKQIATTVVETDRKLMTVRPKLSDRLLSIPRGHIRAPKFE